MKLRVCHSITMLELGGAQENTLYTIRHCDPARFESFLVCGTGGLLDEEARRWAAGIGDPARARFLNSLVRPILPWKDLKALADLVAAFRRIRPHIVHTHSSKAGILGRWAARIAGVPCLLHTFHGFGFHDEQPPPLRWALILAERAAARISQRLICVSRENMEKAIRLGIGRPERFAVIRSGIETEKYSPPAGAGEAKRREFRIPAEAPVVGTLTNFKPQKDPVAFVRVCGLVAQKFPAARFLVVGDGMLRKKCEQLAARMGVRDRMVFAGWRRDIPQVLAAMDVFCLTSRWEGLPRSLLQAMAAGRPVVATYVDGTREILHEGVNGYGAYPHEEKKIAERIGRLLADPARRARMGEEARRTVTEEFDIRKMVRDLEALYEECAREKGLL